MSDSPQQPQRQREEQVSPREEAALPVAASGTPAHTGDPGSKRRTTLRVVGGTIVISILMSAIIEYGGWQRAFMDMPAPHAPIPPLSFLRGVWDTTLGAVGIGTGGALLTLLIPSTWKAGWRRVPAAFALGAASFLAFLSFVTFDFIR